MLKEQLGGGDSHGYDKEEEEAREPLYLPDYPKLSHAIVSYPGKPSNNKTNNAGAAWWGKQFWLQPRGGGGEGGHVPARLSQEY